MRLKLLSLIPALLLLMSFATAIDTEINVKTLLNDKVSIQLFDPSQVYYLLNSYHINSGSGGIVTVKYSGSEEKINIKVIITENSQQIMTEKFEDIKTGSPIYLQLLPGNVSSNYKQTLSNDENISIPTQDTVQNVSNATQDIPSNSADNIPEEQNIKNNTLNKILSSQITSFLAGIIVILICLFFLKKIRTYKNNVEEERKHYSNMSAGQLKKELIKSRKMIKEAREEIGNLKNKEKIKELEIKIQENEKSLRNKIDKEKRELKELKK